MLFQVTPAKTPCYGLVREPARSCFGSFVSHTKKVPWFLRKGRGRLLMWAGANRGTAGGPASRSRQGRGQGHSTSLLTRVVQRGSGGELGPACPLEPVWERLAAVVQNLLGRLSEAREGSIRAPSSPRPSLPTQRDAATQPCAETMPDLLLPLTPAGSHCWKPVQLHRLSWSWLGTCNRVGSFTRAPFPLYIPLSSGSLLMLHQATAAAHRERLAAVGTHGC